MGWARSSRKFIAAPGNIHSLGRGWAMQLIEGKRKGEWGLTCRHDKKVENFLLNDPAHGITADNVSSIRPGIGRLAHICMAALSDVLHAASPARPSLVRNFRISFGPRASVLHSTKFPPCLGDVYIALSGNRFAEERMEIEVADKSPCHNRHRWVALEFRGAITR